MILFYIVITALVFLYGFQIGKSKSVSEIKPCDVKAVPAVNSEIVMDLTGLPICPDNVEDKQKVFTVEDKQKAFNHCVESPYNSDKTFLHLAAGTIPEDIFPNIHHPGSPAKWSFVMTQSMTWPATKKPTIFEAECKEIYITRSGSRANQPNKCTAVVKVREGMASHVHSSHRIGYTALLTGEL